MSRAFSVGPPWRARLFGFLALQLALPGGTSGQAPPTGETPPMWWGGARVFETAQHAIRVVRLAELERPWGIAFLPDGSLLVTEREGRLRIIRGDALAPRPIAGVPEVQPAGSAGRRNGLMDIALHPQFVENRVIYLTYTKPGEGGAVTTALARARYPGGNTLVDVRDILVADNWSDADISQTAASRIVFGRDGMLYMSIGAPNAPASQGIFSASRGGRAQDPSSHGGKVLRLRDDGSVPDDNPFVRRPGYLPEIYTLGHRNPMGLTIHPETGEIWLIEAGPRDGDEVNILRAGANYGWPAVGIGRDYSGDWIGGPVALGVAAGRADANRMWMEGMEQPFLFWVPAVTPSGMTFYSGAAFPTWKGDLFIGALSTKTLERYSFNGRGQPQGKYPEYLLREVGQRIRDVRQGPDGLLYVLTDHDAIYGADTTPGAVFRIEPIN